ncbi:MAG: GTPase HflX [Abditibacteriota bacterium]|nr:GTPase HflX [Abditibacteriota bacterium]
MVINNAVLAVSDLATDYDSEHNSLEMRLLCESAGVTVLDEYHFKRRNPDPESYMGSGNAESLKWLCAELGADLVIFSEDLSPNQIRYLENVTDTRVVDRTQLILDIFALRAHSNEGKLQVELAQLQYLLPRLTGKGVEMSRISGGAGVAARGPGETKLETDRRRIRQRIGALKKKIADISDKRSVSSQQRKGLHIPSACLVGYTSAGKSTLINLLSGSLVLTDQMLFSTLDNTCRRASVPGGSDFLITDTVGFISRLPYSVIAAFRATISEALDCDFLIHVADASDRAFSHHIQSVRDILADMGAGDKPVITVFNKWDLVQDKDFVLRLRDRTPDSVVISAETGYGLDELYLRITDTINALFVPVRVLIPYECGKMLSLLHSKGLVSREEHLDYGTYAEARLPRSVATVFQDYQV